MHKREGRSRATLDDMTRMKVLIIGGGIAGVSLGSELAVDHDVVVLEAEQTLAHHSTGRSAALFVEGYGPATVQALTRASGPLFDALTQEHQRPLLTPRGAILTAWDPATVAMLELQLPGLEPLTAEQVTNLCPVIRSDDLLLAAIDRQARDIDVMALHEIFVSTLRARGGKTVTGARVSRANKQEGVWTLTTNDGRAWSADVVVNAAGAWGDQVANLFGVRGNDLSPCRRTVVIARTARAVDVGWPVIVDAAEAWYFKPEGGALLLSPGDETPVEPGDAKPDPLDIATVLDRVNAVTDLELRSVQTAWAGLRTFAPDRVPVVGAHPEEPSLFCFVGQGGYGIQMAPALARAGAEIFRTGTSTDAGLADALDPARVHAPVAL